VNDSCQLPEDGKFCVADLCKGQVPSIDGGRGNYKK
jgi:hypothetical protein